MPILRLRVERQDPMRPAYRVPTMAEIEALPWNGLTVASTFSGAGGSCLGYRMAGYRVAYAAEFVEAARQTYKANHPNSYLDPRDVRQIKGSEILDIVGREVDILDGSPPCASFSTAGSREKGWGKVKAYSDVAQRTDDLFDEYIRLIGEVRPRVFVAENVAGLVKGTAKGYFIRVMRAMKAQGYRVACRVLDAQWLGVPQARQRTIFVGVREDLNREPAHPDPVDRRVSVAEALVGLPSPLRTDSPTPSMDRFEVGKEWKNVKIGESSDRYFSLVRVDPSKPCPTVLACHGDTSKAGITHWNECRRFHLNELRRICGFPDDFVLHGDFRQQWERLGRAVPPLMMRAVAATIQAKVLT
jgi:DNA (cytosine-5)-methyltransferase 1